MPAHHELNLCNMWKVVSLTILLQEGLYAGVLLPIQH
jgi:hypothetical protein